MQQQEQQLSNLFPPVELLRYIEEIKKAAIEEVYFSCENNSLGNSLRVTAVNRFNNPEAQKMTIGVKLRLNGEDHYKNFEMEYRDLNTEEFIEELTELVLFEFMQPILVKSLSKHLTILSRR